jgi:hypothetical protein
MVWDKTIILPKPPNIEAKRQIRYLSPPLMRFCGALGINICGFGVLCIGTSLFGLNPIWRINSNWDWKVILLVVISIIAAIIGFIIGIRIGLNINVKSERINHIMSVLWHYLATGGIIWVILSLFCINKIFGKDGIKQYLIEFDEVNFSVICISIGIGGCILIGAFLLLTGLLKQNSKPKALSCIFLALPVTSAMGFLQFYLLGINSPYWIFMGILLPFILIPIAAFMINRDDEQHLQILSE